LEESTLNINKRENESDFDYHKRIIYGKLVDKTLSDYDYAELSKYAYGKDYAPDTARRMFYGSRKTLEALDADTERNIEDDGLLSEIDQKMMELRKERQKFFDQRTALNKVLRDRSRQEELNEILVAAVRDGNLPSLNYQRNYIEAEDKTLLVSLNDIHYGVDINNAWNKYNSSICRDMLCQYLDRIISIGEMHKCDDCIVFCNGDMINGKIRLTVQLSNKENIIEQVKGVSELIAEFLAELSKYFNTVSFVSVSGNHSRLGQSKEDSPVGERLDDLIEWYLDARLQNIDNVYIGDAEKIDSTMYIMDIRGKVYIGVHGDMEANPSKIAGLQAMVGCPVYAILCGHKHHNMIDEVNGVKLVMAGSFMGVDDYCIQKRIYGRPQQMVCVCDDTGIMCHYDIDLSLGQDDIFE
jgi:predicted phosphodiesterase